MDDVNSLLDNELDPELPGGDMEFRDVTGIFLEGAGGKTMFHIFKEFAYRGFFFFGKNAELEPDNLLFMESFTLQDAMSALEVRGLSPAH